MPPEYTRLQHEANTRGYYFGGQYSARACEIVLDLFGGSSSTLIAALQTGHRAFLMELDPLCCDLICNSRNSARGDGVAKFNDNSHRLTLRFKGGPLGDRPRNRWISGLAHTFNNLQRPRSEFADRSHHFAKRHR